MFMSAREVLILGAARTPIGKYEAAQPPVVERDEHPRETTIESLGKLPPVFGEVEGQHA
jgi:acetyl-CoA acetyltransferase